jgi:hypothetical protein
MSSPMMKTKFGRRSASAADTIPASRPVESSARARSGFTKASQERAPLRREREVVDGCTAPASQEAGWRFAAEALRLPDEPPLLFTCRLVGNRTSMAAAEPVDLLAQGMDAWAIEQMPGG